MNEEANRLQEKRLDLYCRLVWGEEYRNMEGEHGFTLACLLAAASFDPAKEDADIYKAWEIPNDPLEVKEALLAAIRYLMDSHDIDFVECSVDYQKEVAKKMRFQSETLKWPTVAELNSYLASVRLSMPEDISSKGFFAEWDFSLLSGYDKRWWMSNLNS